MSTSSADVAPSVPEHFLAALYGLFAIALGATVWSAMAAVFGVWSLSAAPGLGWLIAWTCRYGGRRTDAFVRVAAWLMALAGVLLALLVFSAFSVTRARPTRASDSARLVSGTSGLFAEPPWFGSAAVLLALVGTWRALRDRPARREDARPAREPTHIVTDTRSRVPRAAAGGSGSRAA